ncbi:Serine/threonine-protein kinase/endoribonuclease ire-1 [Pseudolycoriella hygida]|uniref:non-specific serine/threonine protein kinase n=1 Tax=Pseudolycoriella hygida TaxID=35572 RepID=A0A9Q0N4B0_9DIPT|nr:Serine/threonine-protein kinase/endoribonuclease ire-1 [Pseudolycoriella hygida]
MPVRMDCTDLARDDETLLVFSTLGGGLTALDPVTSEIRWSIEDEPTMVNVPTNSDVTNPQYLPDPRDGSLYQLGDMGGLKKLPYTIPQLVANAPCRSSDGILYSGKKSDTWFLIDPKTGQREQVLGFGSPSQYADKIGWATSRAVYLGRTQYTVLMYDSMSINKKPFNVTFFDYSSHTMAPEVSKEYEWLHLTSSSSGMVATINRDKGTFLWQKDLTSPVVATFLLSSDGLLSVPFTTVSDETLIGIIEYARDGQKNNIKLFHTLYVGEHSTGLYALPSLVDKKVATISADPPVKLIDGPNSDSDLNPNLVYLNTLLKNNEQDNQQHHRNVIVLGHYQMPKTVEDLTLSISPSLNKKPSDNRNLVAADKFDVFNINPASNEQNNFIIIYNNENTVRVPDKGDDSPVGKETLNATMSPREYLANVYTTSQNWLNAQESKILKLLLIILIGMIIAMFWYMRSTVRELRQSQGGSQSSNISRGSGSYQELIDLGEGEVKVGKISFNSNQVLGKGCEGTFVFKGTFEKRNVAVKRLLPECFTLADREVSLLRESDAHENVVRYFCTEQDRQFKYIAVELCWATLQDYIEGGFDSELRCKITVKDILRQATNGLLHLHMLHIVHRDIKPQNVLISLPNNRDEVRAMISDFGLCKKLNLGKTSFSRRSGITGTEGWIAPEMLKGQRTTTSVDIFSLGCVFYYVLSNGGHPFGDTVKRQLNILSYEYDLKIFSGEKYENSKVLAEELIVSMISKDPARRPPASAIANHPFFWNEEKILSFLQDVSDRVEKLDYSMEPLKTLEKNGKFVVRQDWNLHLDEAISADLRKFRGYHGSSVRDLLRALRNKKHHYHELPNEMQLILGPVPIDFTKYWIQRFPYLVSHSFHALEKHSHENAFQIYYDSTFRYAKPDYFYQETDDCIWPEKFNKKSGDSPRKFHNDFRSRNHDRRTSQDTALDANNRPLTENVYKPSNKRGSYNFHKNSDADTTLTFRKGNWRKPTNISEDANLTWTISNNGE